MNNLNGRKTLALIIIISFFSGSIPVYASTLLGQDTLTYLEDNFNKYLSGFHNSIQSQGKDSVTRNTENLIQYINTSMDQVITDAKDYTNQEEARIDSELSSYAEELAKEMVPAFEDQKERLKKIISEYTDAQIQDSKKALRSELNAELQKMIPSVD